MNGKEIKQFAVLSTEVTHIKEKQTEMTNNLKEMTHDVKEIKDILFNGSNKISINRQCIRANTARVKRVENIMLGTIGALLVSILGVVTKLIFF